LALVDELRWNLGAQHDIIRRSHGPLFSTVCVLCVLCLCLSS